VECHKGLSQLGGTRFDNAEGALNPLFLFCSISLPTTTTTPLLLLLLSYLWLTDAGLDIELGIRI
jgi:hypothetical protein